MRTPSHPVRAATVPRPPPLRDAVEGGCDLGGSSRRRAAGVLFDGGGRPTVSFRIDRWYAAARVRRYGRERVDSESRGFVPHTSRLLSREGRPPTGVRSYLAAQVSRGSTVIAWVGMCMTATRAGRCDSAARNSRQADATTGPRRPTIWYCGKIREAGWRASAP